MSENVGVIDRTKKGYDIIITVADDYYSARITVDVYDDEVDRVDKDDLMMAIAKKNVVYGVDYNVINKVLRRPREIDQLDFAVGEKHVNGKDGFIDYYFNTDTKSVPKLLDDGTVDHKELKEIQKIRKGEILAKVTPPTEKHDGITVTGKKISGKPGYFPRLRGGKNVIVSDDGLIMFSNVDGVIDFENSKIGVKKVYEVSHDVGVSTGNISYDGKIIIRGNVEYGYSVSSNDDIEIYGLVEGAHITGNNISVHKGIHNNSVIRATGEVRALYIENGDIIANGNIYSDTMLHSKVKCKGAITVSNKKGLIIGGSISARRGIVAKVIGSHIGSKTRLNLGIDDDLMGELKTINIRQKKIEEDIAKINKSIDFISRKRGNTVMQKVQIEKQLKLKQNRLDALKELENSHSKLCEMADSLRHVKLVCDVVYAGTNLRINNSHFNIKQKLERVRFIKEDGEVKIYSN